MDQNLESGCVYAGEFNPKYEARWKMYTVTANENRFFFLSFEKMLYR